MNQPISRRKMLVGAGASIALPLLGASPLRAAKKAAPKRLVFLNFGFGTSKTWYPTTTGVDYQLTGAMESLKQHREKFSVIGNLSNVATPAHWGCTTFLTSVDTRRTPGRGFHNAISCDQIAANYLGRDVRFGSLEVTGSNDECNGAGPGASMAWDAQGNSITGESDHVSLFHRLFGGGDMTVEERRRLLGREKSVLDAVRSDAKSIAKEVGVEDREKLDEYFTLVRNIEQRLGRDESWLDRPLPSAPIAQPRGGLTGTQDIEMMFDLMVAALQTDSSRVISYRMPTLGLLNEFGEETGTGVGVHNMTHYGNTETHEYKALLWRDRRLCELFSTFIGKLEATRDVDGQSLLDNTLVVMGTGIRTGHQTCNLPILLAGQGGGKVNHGAHYLYKENEGKLSNLWLSMLKHVGCPVDSFANSDGPLTEIFS